MLAVGDHGSPKGGLLRVTESLYLVSEGDSSATKNQKGLCAELGVDPHRLQLGEHLREEAGLGVDPQHRAAGIRDELTTVVLSNFLYLDMLRGPSSGSSPFAKHRPVGWTVKCPVMPASSEGTKVLLNHIKFTISLAHT